MASDPVASRTVAALAADRAGRLKAIRAARAAARERACALARDAAPGANGGLVIVDMDATLVRTGLPRVANRSAPSSGRRARFYNNGR